jgi:hypothetical protein
MRIACNCRPFSTLYGARPRDCRTGHLGDGVQYSVLRGHPPLEDHIRLRIKRLSRNHGWRFPSWKSADSIVAPLTDVGV